MSTRIAVRLDLSKDFICEEILSLQLASYAVEASLIGYDRIPALFDSHESLRLSGDTFLGYVEHGTNGRSLSGAVSFQHRERTIEISRLVVRPDRFRRGIAAALLTVLEGWHPDVMVINVETASANAPAVQLYKKLGYEEMSRREVPGGLFVSRFRKGLA